MSDSCEELRDTRFTLAQRSGWVYDDTVAHKGEGYGRKDILKLSHPKVSGFHLFIGPRGGMKTGRSYRSSACRFWDDTPTPAAAAAEHGYDA